MNSAAALAMQSDPTHNRQFRRAWVDPPDKRKRRPGGGGVSKPNITTTVRQIAQHRAGIKGFEARLAALVLAWQTQRNRNGGRP